MSYFSARLPRRDTALRVTALQMRALTPLQWHEVLSGQPEEAARWLNAGAHFGLVEAQTALGQILLDGRGVARDAVAAAQWFAIAAGAGHPPADNMLGRCWERGWGLTADFPRAAACYRTAAEAGLDWAQYNLANMLLRGRGVPQNRAQALAWYRRAAAQGHAKSINLIGRFQEEGWEMPADREAARKHYTRAAEGGDFRGQYNLASLLASDGDIEAAIPWLQQAAAIAPQDFLELMGRRLASSPEPQLKAIGKLAEHRAATAT